MKKVFMSLGILILLAGLVFAGKQVITPKQIILNTDKVELMEANFKWGSLPEDNTCVVTYKIWNDTQGKLLREETYVISGADFNSLVSGYGATMESRLESNIWQNIQNNWSVAP